MKWMLLAVAGLFAAEVVREFIEMMADDRDHYYSGSIYD